MPSETRSSRRFGGPSFFSSEGGPLFFCLNDRNAGESCDLQMLMPDTSQPAFHKPFYRRIWFLSLVGLLVCLAGAAGFLYFWVIVRYEKKAEEFNLAKLEDLES